MTHYKSQEVTENDFRSPEFRGADTRDYEKRPDGKIVRKDRWESAVRAIAGLVGFDARDGFEVDEVVQRVRELVATAPADVTFTADPMVSRVGSEDYQ